MLKTLSCLICLLVIPEFICTEWQLCRGIIQLWDNIFTVPLVQYNYYHPCTKLIHSCCHMCMFLTNYLQTRPPTYTILCTRGHMICLPKLPLWLTTLQPLWSSQIYLPMDLDFILFIPMYTYFLFMQTIFLLLIKIYIREMTPCWIQPIF